jgi:hypothetical protein
MWAKPRYVWIAAIVVFEVLALSYFVLHAPPVNDDSGVPDIAILGDMRSSPNVRHCLPAQQRDARFADVARHCVTVRERQQALVELIYEAKVMLEKLGIVYWLDCDSLLGQYHTGDVTLWDLSADMGILEEGLALLRVSAVDLSNGYELNVWGSALHLAHRRDENIPVRLVEKKFGFFIDVVVFHAIKNPPQQPLLLGPPPSARWISCAKCPSVPGATDSHGAAVKQFAVPRDWILPTLPCSLRDFEVMCPAQAAAYLQHFYGDNFLEPKVW